MPKVVVIGDGPAGLSAALFLAKLDAEVEVFGQDETLMHKAYLYNYLGIEEISGTDFMAVGRRQVERFGARIHDVPVSAIEPGDGGFSVRADDGATYDADYVVLASGKKRELATALGLEVDEDGGVAADRNGRTAVDKVYCVGWTSRTAKIQAIISAGDGAAAALDILSREAGKDIHDFDVPA